MGDSSEDDKRWLVKLRTGALADGRLVAVELELLKQLQIDRPECFSTLLALSNGAPSTIADSQLEELAKWGVLDAATGKIRPLSLDVLRSAALTMNNETVLRSPYDASDSRTQEAFDSIEKARKLRMRQFARRLASETGENDRGL